MKIPVFRKRLKRGLITVSRTVPSRTPLPIAKHVLMTASNGQLKLSATNMKSTITTWSNTKVEGATVPL